MRRRSTCIATPRRTTRARCVFRNDAALAASRAVSPDGRYLALVKPRTSADSDVYLVDLGAKKHTPQLITKHEGNVTHDVYSFTRDSKQLVYSTDEFGEFNQAWTYDVASRRADAAHPGGLGHLVRRVTPSPAAIASGASTKMRARSCTSSTPPAARRSRCRICRRATSRRSASRATSHASRCW